VAQAAGGVDADAGVGAEMVSVYVPTTPNPTSGFFLMLRKDETIELDMSVDEALKYIVSMGVVAPAARPPRAAPLSPRGAATAGVAAHAAGTAPRGVTAQPGRAPVGPTSPPKQAENS
jgi:uncharacterized membrane protein